MKTVGKILIIIFIVLVVLAFTKDFFIQKAIEGGVSLVTGLRLTMKQLAINIPKTFIEIKELKIYNPSGFEEPVMLDMPEILVDYKLSDIFKGMLHLESLVINLKEFNVVKNSKGAVNLDSLKVAQEGEQKKKEKAEPKPKKEGKSPAFQVDALELIVGTVTFKDYSKSAESPFVNVYDFNLNENYTDITNPQIIIAIIVQKALLKASLAQFDLGNIQNNLTSAVGNVSDLARGAVGSAQAAAGTALETAKEAASVEGIKSIGSSTADTAKDAVSALKAQGETLKGLTSKLKLPGKSE